MVVSPVSVAEGYNWHRSSEDERMVIPMIWYSLFLVMLLATPSKAATINAVSCSSAHVQSAVNAATAGDTVTVPSGNCTWTVPVDINAKRLTITGAGIGMTTITDSAPNRSGPTNGALLVRGASNTNFVNISGFTFIKNVSHASGGIVNIVGTPETVAFRVHHVRFSIPSSGAASIYVVGPYGLIDHVTFDVTATRGSIHAIEGFGAVGASDGGFGPWMQPSAIGTNRAIFIEDSQITYSVALAGVEVCIDGFSGVRYVIRYNTFTNCSPGWHGTDSGSYRSLVSAEIYNNTFINNSTRKFRGATIRGGSGVIHNNTYASTVGWDPYTLQIFRLPGSGLPISNWESCDGSLWEIGSTNFSEKTGSRVCSLVGSPQRVKFCSGNRDLVCADDSTCAAAGAGTCTTYFDGAASDGYPCRDQPGRGSSGQGLAPWYEWNNTGPSAPTFEAFPMNTRIQANRDYYVATRAPGYSPFTYPYPLQTLNSQASDLTPPAAPMNVSAQ